MTADDSARSASPASASASADGAASPSPAPPPVPGVKLFLGGLSWATTEGEDGGATGARGRPKGWQNSPTLVFRSFAPPPPPFTTLQTPCAPTFRSMASCWTWYVLWAGAGDGEGQGGRAGGCPCHLIKRASLLRFENFGSHTLPSPLPPPWHTHATAASTPTSRNATHSTPANLFFNHPPFLFFQNSDNHARPPHPPTARLWLCHVRRRGLRRRRLCDAALAGRQQGKEERRKRGGGAMDRMNARRPSSPHSLSLFLPLRSTPSAPCRTSRAPAPGKCLWEGWRRRRRQVREGGRGGWLRGG